jgi:predicted tellurium resistance membrane protein TerC
VPVHGEEIKMEWITDPQGWIALATLTALEIVLGIDNIIFISILAGRLPASQQDRARTFGLTIAMFSRIALLLSITWVMALTKPIVTLLGNDLSGRDFILMIGGLFLLAKSTHEIHNNLEGYEEEKQGKSGANFIGVLVQIAILDIVFSLDSVITAVGLTEHIAIMIVAVVLSVGVMIFSAKTINDFVEKHPTIKMLALSFLILVGVTLIGEGLAFHIPKGYIYFAMAFSIGVEIINIKMRARKHKPVKLHYKGEKTCN